MRFVLLLLLLAGCASPLPQPPYEAPPPTPTADLNTVKWLGPKPTQDDLDTYVSNFRRLAFWTEWNGHHPFVKKSTKERVCSPDKYRAQVGTAIAKVRAATGVRLRIVNSGCQISVRDRVGLVGCGANSRGLVAVGTGTPLSDCLEEEFSQIMGLYNDIPYRWTLWNDENTGKVRGLTWHDAVMLRVLYHSELYQGMPEAEAMKIVPGLMRKVILEVSGG